MHLHLGAIGSAAGDMFAACVSDAFPDLRPGLLETSRQVGLPDGITGTDNLSKPAKFNRLMKIEAELGSRGRYVGKQVFDYIPGACVHRPSLDTRRPRTLPKSAAQR